jgi:hypothetical protein
MSTQNLLQAEVEQVVDAKLSLLRTVVPEVVIIVGVVLMDWWTTGGITWSIWPALGMGISLVTQASGAITQSAALRDRMIEREIRARQ